MNLRSHRKGALYFWFINKTEMIKIQGRLLRGSLAIGNAIILDATMATGAWAVAFAAISTYLIFTAVTGECVVREYLFRPTLPSTGDNK